MSPFRSPRLLASVLCAALALAGPTAFPADAPGSIIAKLQPAAGWTAPDFVRTAAGTGLFELIDGGAELYHEFGFKRAAAWSLETAERASIQIELYEMTDAPAAYGVWSIMQTGQFTRGTLGQGSLRFGYYVAFWSGSYFASVTGARADVTTQAEVDRVAAQLTALLPSDGTLPGWFDRLPSAGMVTRKYFRGKIALSNIETGHAAELVDGSEGILAEYADRRVVIFHFGSAQEAAQKLAEAQQKAQAAKQPFSIEQSGTDLIVTSTVSAK